MLFGHCHPVMINIPIDGELSKKAFSKAIPKIEYRSQIRIKRHERGI
jgi:hypothetical protein